MAHAELVAGDMVEDAARPGPEENRRLQKHDPPRRTLFVAGLLVALSFFMRRERDHRNFATGGVAGNAIDVSAAK